MNHDLCYLYPITRVRSVERILRTTAHSAFLIVTPVNTSHVRERPANVTDKHMPQLYSRASFTEGHETDGTLTELDDEDEMGGLMEDDDSGA